MTSLATTERLFAAELDTRAADPPATPFAKLLIRGDALTPRQRIGVYRNNSRGARTRTLETIYSVCRQVLGKNCFRALSADYLDAHPSISSDLNLFGSTLPSFLSDSGNSGPLLGDLPYLPDLARLEWNWHALYYAADDPPFDMEAFAQAARGADAPRIRFRLSSALAMLESPYPIHEIWRRHREGDETGSVEVDEGDRLVLVRETFSPRVVQVDLPTFSLLDSIAARKTLGELEKHGADLESLPGLIQAGWITDFTPHHP